MMRPLSLFIILSLFLASLCSCGSEPDAYEMLCEFVRVYGAEGVVYSPSIPEGKEGYMPSELADRIYRFSGKPPDNFAVLLNSHTDGFYECGVFVSADADSLSSITETCLERVRLLSGAGENGFVKVNGRVVFYSTLSDRDRAERIWREIISKK